MSYSLALAINAMPCILSCIVWTIQRKDRSLLVVRRRVIFLIALAASTICSASLLVFLLWHFYGEGHPFGGVVEDKLFLSMIALGLLSAGIAIFGRGLSRGLLVANGFLVALQWWLLAGLGF